ncbi:MAG: 3-oxoacyl-[acyl-carrier-protein] reductase [Ruminococcus sp.]|jgi:3-oxoacyl-[acyl-carrier protein] reductase|nr:3-oxoacyl-[acyl-carrier-protein] reductase [Ruminococcus sp.]
MAKTAIITGSARGIGAAIALKLAQSGFNVALNDLNEKSFEGTDIIAECEKFGITAKAYYADVSKSDECEKLAKAVKEDFGEISALVNNAGITRDGLIARMSDEQYDMVIAVNQKSVFNMTKFVSNIMLRQKYGRIVNIASVAGLYGNPGQMNYSASKAAVIGMTKTAAKELGRKNITVNAVAPGFISTPMTDKLTEEQKAKMLEAIAMRRYGTPEEVAEVVDFLCSDKASYVTGQVIEISGGLSM